MKDKLFTFRECVFAQFLRSASSSATLWTFLSPFSLLADPTAVCSLHLYFRDWIIFVSELNWKVGLLKKKSLWYVKITHTNFSLLLRCDFQEEKEQVAPMFWLWFLGNNWKVLGLIKTLIYSKCGSYVMLDLHCSCLMAQQFELFPSAVTLLIVSSPLSLSEVPASVMVYLSTRFYWNLSHLLTVLQLLFIVLG